MNNVRLLIRCCYLGMFTQAVVINLAPVLFIPLKEQLGLTFEQIGRLVLINFVTQVAFDLACGPLIDRLGAKWFAVSANLLACVGLVLFAGLPWLMDDAYTGLMIGTIVFSMGAGILELVLSPIINSLPSERKAADMSLAHSFYGIGQVCTVLLTALAVYLLGASRWPWIVLAWSIVPATALVGFALTRIGRLVEESQRHKLRQLIRRPAYLGCIATMLLAGATEVSLAQWTSAFAEEGLGFSKIFGDLVGLSLFAAGLAIMRVWFGFRGQHMDMHRVLIASTLVSLGVYLVAALSPWPIVSLVACVIGGFSVSLLWPGMLTVSAARFPMAGASMFALLSAAGDTGAATMPWLVGVVADRAGLHLGLLVPAICPLVMLVLVYKLGLAAGKRAQKETGDRSQETGGNSEE